MQKKVILKIYGRVQGVLFRRGSMGKACELGLAGFARNEPDGAVYIEAEGEEEKLKDFIKWCRSGPDYAKVEKVETEWLPVSGEFQDFQVQ